MLKVLLADHFDSFTYNLVQLFRETTPCELQVIPCNALNDTELTDFDRIVLGPGPGVPSDYPSMQRVISYGETGIPILGICLGHQAIGVHYGASLINMQQVVHGIQKEIRIVDPEDFIFKGLSSPINVGLYHSWALSGHQLPLCLRVTATSNDGVIMAIAHKTFPLKGLQFHPESYMTESGRTLIRNWLQ